MEEAEMQRRKLTLEDEHQIWKDITLTQYITTDMHCSESTAVIVPVASIGTTVCCFSLKKILRVSSLDDVLDQDHVNPQNIVHNMTKVNKHGVVTLEDKTGRFRSSHLSGSSQLSMQQLLLVDLSLLSSDDLPHWVLNAMKSLANCE